MAKSSWVAAGCGMAAAGCGLLAAPGLGFAIAEQGARSSGVLAQQQQQVSLVGAGALPPQQPQQQQPVLAVAGGVALGLAAAAGTATTRRRPTIAAKASPDWAGGLVGSEHHGWGEYKWDPLEFSTNYPEHLPWYREAELKHGRVAMLAMLGLVVPDWFRIPLPEFADPGLDVINSHNKLIYGLGTGPMWWLLVFCAIPESLRLREIGLDASKLTLETAGDLNFGKGFLPKTEEGRTLMKIKELKNGRLAMLAFSGCITQSAMFDVHHFPFVPGQ